MTTSKPELTKHRSGCYRFDLAWGCFGQVHLDQDFPREWVAEIRRLTGSLIRYAGVWKTRAAAINEILSINSIDYYQDA